MPAVTVKRLVCLANSRMPGGSCVAGRILESHGRPGPWVRPVSGRENEGVAPRASRYVDGGTPSLLDVMDVPVLNALPRGHQQENWLLDLNRRWAKMGSVRVADLPEWTDEPETLWVNGCKTSQGQNDKVKASDADSLGNSLCLIKVDLTICVFDQYNSWTRSTRRRTQARFRYRGTDYWMWLTDPGYEVAYKQRSEGTYPLGECYVTVSLSGVNDDGYAYKLAAAIIEP